MDILQVINLGIEINPTWKLLMPDSLVASSFKLYYIAIPEMLF